MNRWICFWILVFLLRAPVSLGELVDRIAAVVGDDIVSWREVLTMEAYLRYRRDHAVSEMARQNTGPLLHEAYEEAITRKVLLQALRADPGFRLARGAAKAEAIEAFQKRSKDELIRALEPYGLALDEYIELESMTVGIQDYVHAKFSYAIIPTPPQVDQAIAQNDELRQALGRLSDEGKQQIRAMVSHQLEFENFMEQSKKFTEKLRAEAKVVQVFEPRSR